MRIGRSRDNDLVIPDEGTPAAGRHHAEAVFETGRWWLIDLGSANGTVVNGSRVTRHALQSDDRLRLGSQELVVRIARGWRPSAAAIVLLLAALLAVATAIGVMWRPPPAFERAAGIASRATYLLAAEAGGGRSAVGTAFAVTRDGLLATNAHVAHELRRRARAGGRSLAVRTEPETDVRYVSRVWLHPGWQPGSIREDVAVVRLEPGTATVPLSLAGPRALARLARGSPVGAFGFPAASTDVAVPRGRLTVDVIGEIRANRYFAVGLHVAPGTSGSPIFTEDGTVVALVAGGDFAAGAGGTRPTGTGMNWGVSVAAVRELLERVEAEPREQP